MPETRREPGPGLDTPTGPRWPGWGTTLLALAGYTGALAVATRPVFTTFTTALPGPLGDPLQHLWIIRWSRSCLLAGRPPFFCPDVQIPVGAPLGLFSPMTLQTALFTALGSVLRNEVLIYNLIWLFGLLGTGMGTYLLAWFVLRDRGAAVFAGLAGVLSTPLMMHAQGHLELIQLGALPVFLVAWVRFVDRPSPARLLAAWGAFALLGASAAYFVVLTPFPAAWYVAWRVYESSRRGAGAWPWLRPRVVPLAAFAGSVVPVLFALFSPQVWAASHGFALTRSWAEFEWNGAPVWGYAVPTTLHGLGRLLPWCPDPGRGADGAKAFETASYLGVVPLGLIAYALARRVRFPRSGYWWSVFALLVVLSMGATARWGRLRVDLPGSLLWSVFPPFRLIRVPARFNLPACVVAAVLAAAGLRDLLGRLPRGWARAAAWCAAVLLTAADLAVSPFMTSRPPGSPAGYALLDRVAPGASVLDAPLVGSAAGHPLPAVCAYWQSRRGGRTTAGYSGVANVRFDHLMVHGSPFGARELADPAYLADPTRQTFGVVTDVPFLDYAWLYLTAHEIDHVVLHHWPGSVHQYLVRFERLDAVLAGAKIYGDAATTVFARARLPMPSGPIVLCGEGWRSRPGWPGPLTRVTFPDAQIIAYSPGPGRDLTFRLRASAFRAPRAVRLLSGGVELARWRVEPGAPRTYLSPPFRLPEGLHHLTLATDGAARPRAHREAFDDGLTPYSLRVTEIGLRSDPGPHRFAGGGRPGR